MLRGLVGISKSKTIDKKPFRWKYLTFTLLVAMLVGTVTGIFASQTWKIAFLAGYAGTDFLEGLYRAKLSKYISLG